MRTWALRLVVLAAAVLAVAGLWRSATAEPPRPLEEQTRAVAQDLRCPTCVGEDVADSASPVAGAMRQVVADQLGDGRSPEQIRAWFAERYGDDVLLDPPRRGAGWVLWAVPAVLTGVAVLVLVRRRRRGPLRLGTGIAVAAAATAVLVASWEVLGADRPAPVAEAEPPAGAADVLVHAVAERPGSAQLQLALGRALEEEGRHAEAAEHYAAASRLRPLDAGIASRHATALVRAGRPEEAVRVLESTVATEPEHVPSLLLLGTLQLRAGNERGTALLERFLELAPDHPAATDVRELLAEQPDGHEAPAGVPEKPERPTTEGQR